MKKLLIATTVAASFFAPQAFAQAKSFEGFSVGVNLNAATGSSEIAVGSDFNKNGDSSTNVGVQAAYGLALGESFVLGLGATYDFGDLKGGSISTTSGGYELKGKDRYSVYIEPGFAISSSTMAYAKLGYQGVKGEINLSTGQTLSDDYSGVGYGAGIRSMLNRNMYLQAEFVQIYFDEKTQGGIRSKPSATVGTLGVGYKF